MIKKVVLPMFNGHANLLLLNFSHLSAYPHLQNHFSVQNVETRSSKSFNSGRLYNFKRDYDTKFNFFGEEVTNNITLKSIITGLPVKFIKLYEYYFNRSNNEYLSYYLAYLIVKNNINNNEKELQKELARSGYNRACRYLFNKHFDILPTNLSLVALALRAFNIQTNHMFTDDYARYAYNVGSQTAIARMLMHIQLNNAPITVKEIVAITNHNESTVRSRLERAKSYKFVEQNTKLKRRIVYTLTPYGHLWAAKTYYTKDITEKGGD